jgi:hypothetical protein
MRIHPEGFGKTAFDNTIKDYSTLGAAVDDESPRSRDGFSESRNPSVAVPQQ